MNETIKVLTTRRSVRKFKSDPVPEKVLDEDPYCAAEKNQVLWKQLEKLRKTLVDWSAIS